MGRTGEEGKYQLIVFSLLTSTEFIPILCVSINTFKDYLQTGKSMKHDDRIIYAYCRKQAIEDGVLVDVSEIAREAGFRYPVAVTQALWADINNIPLSKNHEEVNGRLWDVLFLGSMAIRNSKEAADTLCYNLVLSVGCRKRYTVKLVCGPGDDAEPVITLMKTDED